MSSRDSGLNPDTAIAVVGMACRFPGARTIREFWQNLRDGVESIEELTDDEIRATGEDPELLEHPDYVKRASALSGMALWDAGFFGMSPKEAASMDPQHRHFLELSWEALEAAGYAPGTFDGPVGVFAGCGANTYMMFNLLADPDLLREQGFFLLRHIGNDKDFLATRVSYHLNLTGPGINVQTACSTSLTAIHLATQSLLSFECDMALAGGVTITHPHRRGYLYREGEILSPDGRCRAFDADSGGTVLGDGAGAVVLRRLEDALADGDTIHAVVRGTAVNNDGSAKVGYLAPSVEGQSRVVAEALAVADVDASSIGYVEAHGTGTPIGDPIEVTALTRAYRASTDRVGFCGLGSVKTNIGHLDTAAGVAGFIKAVLALENAEIPPSLHFREPNPELELESSPFRVVSQRTPWTRTGGTPRRAAVSSLGVGGTNAHVVLEEAPPARPSPAAPAARRHQLILLSGRSRGVVGRSGARLVDYLETHPDPPLADVAFTLQAGRARFSERRFLVATSPTEVVDALVTEDPDWIRDHTADQTTRSVTFLFAGGGAQYAGMARGLYESEAVFRDQVDRGLTLLDGESAPRVRSLLFPDAPGSEPLSAAEAERPSIALPALFIVQHAQARLWMSWGVEPSAMIGHSMGEYTAACLAGVFSLEEALELVVLRGRLFESVSGGGMLSVPLSETELRPLLGSELSVAAVNGPELCVASGPREAIDRLEAELAEREIEARRIHIDVAAHSSMLEPILDAFGARLREARMSPPGLPFVSNLTGSWITDEDATDPEYWVRQLRETVRFSEGLSELLTDPDRVLLEVGPGRTLATLARIHPDRDPKQEAFTSLRHPDEDLEDEAFLLEVVGRLWQHGVEIDWKGFHGDAARKRIPLPTYPFESEHHLVETGPLPSTHPMVVVGSGHRVGAATEEERAAALDALDAPGAPAAPPAPGDTNSEEPALPDDRPLDALDWLHRIEWVESPFPEGADPDAHSGAGRRPVGAASLVMGSSAVVERVAAAVSDAFPGDRLIRVTFGEHFGRDELGWTLPSGDLESAARLLDEVVDREGLPARIVHAGALGLPSLAIEDPDEDPDAVSPHDAALEAVESGAFFSLFALGRALAEQVDDDEVELVVLTEGAVRLEGDPGHSPAGSLVAGPVRVLPAEVPGIRTRWIDLPFEGLTPSAVTLLTRELVDGDPTHSGTGTHGMDDALPGATPGTGGRAQRVALRPAGRFVPTYGPVDGNGPGAGEGAGFAGVGDGAPAPPPLPDDAVCLITGGFGGLGLEVARHLARRSEARIVLLGR
ncbi:MAG: acyltransferase domain-containing protein, partial [Gemmatimonadales bacterium]